MRYRWLAVAICAAVAGLAALLPPPRHEAVAVLQEFGGPAWMDMDAQNELSRSRLSALIQRYGLYPGESDPVPIMRGAIHIARSGPALVEVRFHYRDAELARTVTNAIAEDVIRIFAARHLDLANMVVFACGDRLKRLARETPTYRQLEPELLRKDYEKAQQQVDRARLQLAAQEQGLGRRLQFRDRARLRTRSLIARTAETANGSEIRFQPSLLPEWLIPFDSSPSLRQAATDAIRAFAAAHPAVRIRRDDQKIWLGTRDQLLLSILLDDLNRRNGMRMEGTVSFLKRLRDERAEAWERIASGPRSDRQLADLALARRAYVDAREQWRLALFASELAQKQLLATVVLMP